MKSRQTERNRLILAAVQQELDKAHSLRERGSSGDEFRHLERAHVLGQAVTSTHVRVHCRMLLWGVRHHELHEVIGQLLRIVGATTKTALGWLPHGNTGGADVSAFRPMPIPCDLQQQLDSFDLGRESSCAV